MMKNKSWKVSVIALAIFALLLMIGMNGCAHENLGNDSNVEQNTMVVERLN